MKSNFQWNRSVYMYRIAMLLWSIDNKQEHHKEFIPITILHPYKLLSFHARM